MAKILIVEDDPVLRSALSDLVKFEHHQVETVDDGADALHLLECYGYDLIVLDWELPKMSGVDILKQFRSNGGTTPILMLTGRKTVNEKETGLDSGADDYLVKPFEDVELMARVRALLRREAVRPQQVLKVGNIELDVRTYRVMKSGKDVHLTPKEFYLLEFFMRNPGEVFNQEALLSRVWKADREITEDSVRICIRRLREKIDTSGQPSLITTVHGGGYRLEKVEE